jgi:6-pyruvoyl-tetrahydropterin synthase
MTKEMINDLVNEIKNEVFDFYNVKVEDETIKDFIDFYYMNEDNEDFKPFDEDGIPVFDTTEREDFMYYLEDLGIVELK